MALSSFEKAFASARKAGKKTFTWNGKSYTTQTKEEAAKAKASAKPTVKPQPRPERKPSVMSTSPEMPKTGGAPAPLKVTQAPSGASKPKPRPAWASTKGGQHRIASDFKATARRNAMKDK